VGAVDAEDAAVVGEVEQWTPRTQRSWEQWSSGSRGAGNLQSHIYGRIYLKSRVVCVYLQSMCMCIVATVVVCVYYMRIVATVVVCVYYIVCLCICCITLRIVAIVYLNLLCA